MNALSLDLRRRLVESVDSGLSQSATARGYGVSSKTVGRLLKRRRESGTLAAKPRPGAQRRIGIEQHTVLAAQMREHPQQSLQEHARRWQQEQGQSISDTTLWRTLKRMGWSHKKRVCAPKSVTRPRVSSGSSRHST